MASLIVPGDSKLKHLSVATPTGSGWDFIGSFATVENAKRVMVELKARGRECSLCMVNGVSVLARR